MEKGPSTYAEYWTSEYFEADHFDRHGYLLGYDTITEYSQGARNFINSSSSNIRKFKAPNGSIYMFNRKTYEFAIISRSGKIVTYYYLEGGSKAFDRLLINENGIEFKE